MQIVSISSLKGGVGKSSVTLGLASAAMDDGHPSQADCAATAKR